MRIQSVAFLIALMLGAAVPGTAHAEPVDHLHGEFADTGSFDDCGFSIEYDLTATFHVLIREVPGSDGQAFIGQENFNFRNVHTNPATGAWFLVRGRELFKEVTARHVEGDIWEFTVHEVGQPFVIEDSNGNVVLRDRGRISIRAVFDTLGDGQPGGILLEEEITGVRGPHPGLDADFCAIATELIG
jgi:hypothetical protein